MRCLFHSMFTSRFLLTKLLFTLMLLTSQAHSSPADTVIPQLEEWKALTAATGGHFSASRYAAFLENGLDWPLTKRIEWRYQRALAQEADQKTLAILCPTRPITQLPALLACASFLPDLDHTARTLWSRSAIITSTDEDTFLRYYGTSLKAPDQWKRYVHLEGMGLRHAAQRQINRLPQDVRALAQARLAARFHAADEENLFNALPSTQQRDASLLLWHLHVMRLQDELDAAFLFWSQNEALFPQASADETRERLALARALLRRNTGNSSDREAALRLTDDTSLPVTHPARQEALLLNGYITLVYAHDPATALEHFRPLLLQPSLAVRAAALYWSARCHEALSSNSTAQQTSADSLMRQASTLPTTFYGQLALARLTQSPFLDSGIRSPTFLALLRQKLNNLPPPPVGILPRSDLTEATRQLSAQGDTPNATLFLSFLVQRTTDPTALAALARLGEMLHLPKASILAARHLARMGQALYPEGWPLPYDPDLLPDSNLSDHLPSGLLPALVRQESAGDPNALSPANAIGLTQILPATARQVAQRHRLFPAASVTPQRLTDPQVNLILGGLYLQDLWARFQPSLALTLAAYNTGPQRAQNWAPPLTPLPLLPPYHSIRDQQEDQWLNWLVLLPYSETRHYISTITTDMSLYALP